MSVRKQKNKDGYTSRNKQDLLTQKYLKEELHYNPDTGEWRWRSHKGGRRKNLIAGSVSQEGYAIVSIGGVIYSAHRLAWFYMTGSWPEGVINHIDYNKLNNAFENLEDVPQRRNAQHAKAKPRFVSTSNYNGVQYSKMNKRWEAFVRVDGKIIGLGERISEDQAAMDWDIFSSQLGVPENLLNKPFGDYLMCEGKVVGVPAQNLLPESLRSEDLSEEYEIRRIS